MSEAIIVALITGSLSLAGVVISNLATAKKNATALHTHQAVTDTKMPFPIFPGVINTVVRTTPLQSRSSRIYSPRRGVMVKELSPTIFAMASEKSPAALMT